jgi:hypothetical protein
MKKQFALRSIRCCVAFLVLSVLGACAAPTLTGPSVLQTAAVVIAPTGVPISVLEGKIIEPLIQDTNDDGAFEPGLAQSWSITSTADNNTFQAVFVLSEDWASQNHSTLRIEDIVQGFRQLDDQLWQDPNIVAITSGAGASGNPCIPTPTRIPRSIPRLQVVAPPVDGNNALTITLIYEDCALSGTACGDIINNIAEFPMYDPDIVTLESILSTGEFVFSIANSEEMVKYNPETGMLEVCPECTKDPDKETVCPTLES